MQEKYDKRAFIPAALAAAASFLAISGVIAKDDEQRRRAIEEEKKKREQFIYWGYGRNVVQIDNTVFRQVQPFSLGPAFHDPNPTSFPFEVRIHKQNTNTFRKGVSDVLPEALILEVRAEKPEAGAVGTAQRIGQGLVIASSFDHRVANQVFTKFTSRNLGNEIVLKEFTHEIENDLFLWMLNEIHSFEFVSRVGETFPNLWGAQVAAHDAALKKARDLQSPLVIAAIPNFNYQQYYKTLR